MPQLRDAVERALLFSIEHNVAPHGTLASDALAALPVLRATYAGVLGVAASDGYDPKDGTLAAWLEALLTAHRGVLRDRDEQRAWRQDADRRHVEEVNGLYARVRELEHERDALGRDYQSARDAASRLADAARDFYQAYVYGVTGDQPQLADGATRADVGHALTELHEASSAYREAE